MRKDGREAMAVVAVLLILSTGMACILSNDGSSVSAANDVYTHKTTNLTVGQYTSGILVQYEEITTNGGCAADNTYTGSIPGITFTAANGSFGYSGTPTQAGSYAVTIGVTGFMSYQYNEFPFVVSEATADTEYTISFSNTYGSASPQSQSADYGQYISLPDPGTRTGYTFDGWYTSSTGGTNVGGSGSSYKVTSSLTLYALWKQVYTHTIIYSSNDGSGAMTNTVVTDYNSGASAVTLAENTYTKDGHTFTGWSINGTVYQPGSTYSVNGNASVTATAQWQQNEITITVDGQSVQMDKGKTVGDVTKPTKSGYTFTGWYSDSGLTSSLSDSTVLTNGMTLYPKFTENVTPTPTYYDHIITYKDGSNTLNTQNNPTTSNSSADTIINYAPTKTGYEFKGWSVNNGSTTADYQYGSTVSVPTSGITLYAIWKETTTPTNTIIVNIDGIETTMQNGSKVSDVVITPKSGCTFDGWYSEATFANKLDDSTVLKNGMYLFSKWTVEKITITVDGKNVQMDSGKKVSDIEKPTKDGYTFIGWYSDEGLTKAVADDTAITAGMTLYSKFSQKAENDYGGIIVSIMAMIVGLGMMYAGYRNGYTVVLILGLIVVVFGGISLGLEKSGNDLFTWISDLFKGGKP